MLSGCFTASEESRSDEDYDYESFALGMGVAKKPVTRAPRPRQPGIARTNQDATIFGNSHRPEGLRQAEKEVIKLNADIKRSTRREEGKGEVRHDDELQGSNLQEAGDRTHELKKLSTTLNAERIARHREALRQLRPQVA